MMWLPVLLVLLAPKDAGALLGISTERLQQLDREGRFRALRDSSGRRLYRKADVLRFKLAREKARQAKVREGLASPR